MDRADELLEQVRRLERELSLPRAEGGEASSGGAPAGRLPRPERVPEEAPEGAEGARVPSGAGLPRFALAEGSSPVQGTDGSLAAEGRDKFSPLLEQVKRLEGAAPSGGSGDRPAFGAPLEGSRGQGGYPLALPGSVTAALSGLAGAAPEGWSSLGAPDRRAPAGGEADWAERADRVFRRDSRRYDGGFYLY